MNSPRLLFPALVLGVLAPLAAGADAPAPTARQIIERIKQHTGLTWSDDTVDTFKTGDPDVPVKKVAVVMMTTFDVIKRAADAGANLIITHEPTFYNHRDEVAKFELEQDPVYRAKRDFIRAHGIVIWRFHDYAHQFRPDMINAGMVDALGWKQYQADPRKWVFVLPPTTLNDLARQVRDRLGIRALRVVGRPGLTVTRVGFSPGFSGFDAHRRLLQQDGVDAVVFGEGYEWESVEYGVDMVSAGENKGMIIMGHVPSEQSGMIWVAQWLKGFVTEVPVEFMPTPEPFWLPQ